MLERETGIASVSVCLSVRPTHAGIDSKLMTVGLCGVNRQVVQGQFLIPTFISCVPWEPGRFARTSSEIWGCKNDWKNIDFRPTNCYFSKTMEDKQYNYNERPIGNRIIMGFRLVALLMALNDLEQT